MSQITYLTNFVNSTGLLLKGLLLTDLMNEETLKRGKKPVSTKQRVWLQVPLPIQSTKQRLASESSKIDR